jgi:hypothetical protein
MYAGDPRRGWRGAVQAAGSIPPSGAPAAKLVQSLAGAFGVGIVTVARGRGHAGGGMLGRRQEGDEGGGEVHGGSGGVGLGGSALAAKMRGAG